MASIPQPPAHRLTGKVLIAILLTLIGAGVAAAAPPTFDDVSSVLRERCVICHSGAGAPLGLRLDTLAGLEAGSINGKVAVPGDTESSELLRRLRGESQPRMPLTGPPYLEPQQIDLIEAWIATGMPPGGDTASPAPRPKPGPGEPVRYADVAPIFLQRCVKCHSDNGIMGMPPKGLRLGNHAQILEGAEHPVVVPGVPGASRLIRRVRGQSRPRMPFDGPPYLSEVEIRLISDWVAQGAPDAQGRPAPLPVGAHIRLEGVLTARWQLDELPLLVGADTRIRKNPGPGDSVEVRGVVRRDGRIEATRIRAR